MSTHNMAVSSKASVWFVLGNWQRWWRQCFSIDGVIHFEDIAIDTHMETCNICRLTWRVIGHTKWKDVCFSWRTVTSSCIWASIYYADGRLTAKSHEVSKPRNSGLDFSNCSKIWQASRQQRCRDTCQIWERHDNYNIQFHGFETSRDLAVRRPST